MSGSPGEVGEAHFLRKCLTSETASKLRAIDHCDLCCSSSSQPKIDKIHGREGGRFNEMLVWKC